MTAPAQREVMLLLGKDHPELDRYTARLQTGGRTACALSAGSSAPRPKGFSGFPNEDAVLAIDEGPCTLLAVGDAHFGPEASHELLARLVRTAEPIPRDSPALLQAILETVDPDGPRVESETTLLVAVWDRERESGFGWSFGDSSLHVIGLEEGARRASGKSSLYVSPWDASSFAPRRARELSFEPARGELVVAFTDGVDECHYRNPDTSVGPRELEDVLIRSTGDVGRFVSHLTELALAGVGGQPGGQDHVAIAATRA